MKKLLTIFARDIRVNVKDFMAMFLILFPIVAAVGINLFSPGINDTTVNLALLAQDKQMIVYYEDFAKVEVFETEEQVKERIMKRDNFVGILPEGDSYYLLAQGNEPEHAVIQYAQLLKTMYDVEAKIEDTNVTLYDFGKTVPPLKKTLVNGMLLMLSVLGGMLISLNIVEEKMDNTVSAINVAPVKRTTWIFGKSLIGLLLPLIGGYALVLITGFTYINFLQLTVMVVVGALLSIATGFLQGLNADDMMTAVAGVKMMMLPLVGSVVGAEIVADKWQWCFYWSPFYWLYKGNDLVLSAGDNWSQVLLYGAIVLAINVAVLFYLKPRIRKGLEKV